MEGSVRTNLNDNQQLTPKFGTRILDLSPIQTELVNRRSSGVNTWNC